LLRWGMAIRKIVEKGKIEDNRRIITQGLLALDPDASRVAASGGASLPKRACPRKQAESREDIEAKLCCVHSTKK